MEEDFAVLLALLSAPAITGRYAADVLFVNPAAVPSNRDDHAIAINNATALLPVPIVG